MGKSLTGLSATGICALSFLFVLIAFSTPYWLETDGQLARPQFKNLGLWSVCFVEFRDPHYWYDTVYGSCLWIFEEEFYVIFDFILPGFFVAVQFFFTLCFTFHLFAIICCLFYLACSRENYRFIHLLVFLGGSLVLAGFCGTIAVYQFGMYGDGRVWMPDWEHNNIGWSYALAVIGVIGSYASGILYLIEARRYKRKRDKDDEMHSGYHMDQLKSTQSTI